MTWQVGSIWAGLALAAASLWTAHPLLALLPAGALVAFGLLLDDGRDAR